MKLYQYPQEQTQIIDDNGDVVNFSGMSGVSPVGMASLDFSSTNVTSAAYVQLLASSPATQKVQIFMSSGEPLYLAFGAAASEANKAFIIPGGNGLIDFTIPAGTRLSLKAVNVVTVNSGVILVNLLG